MQNKKCFTILPRPRGISLITTTYIDTSRGEKKVTTRPHSGYILFVNGSSVNWMIKKQQTEETSAFSSEFIDLKQCIEDIKNLRFKLRFFGIPLSEDQPTTLILFDNESLCKNTSNVESSLNNKYSAIAYHFARWNVAAEVCIIAWVTTGKKLAYTITKILSVVVQDHLFGS